MQNFYIRVQFTSWFGFFSNEIMLVVPKNVSYVKALTLFFDFIKEEYTAESELAFKPCTNVSSDTDSIMLIEVSSNNTLVMTQIEPSVYKEILRLDMESDNYRDVSLNYLC